MTTTLQYQIKNQSRLRQVIWADAILGGTTALTGFCFYSALHRLLGLPTNLILVVATVTLAYAVVALRLATRQDVSIPLLRALVIANWVWTAVSAGLLVTYGNRATTLGLIFLVLQVLIVGGLAYVEGRQLVKTGKSAGRYVANEAVALKRDL